MQDGGIRSGEVAVEPPSDFDAGVWFIGRIRGPWTRRADCPRRGDDETGPEFTVELHPRWTRALEGLTVGDWVQLLYWMHLSRRDLVLQIPADGRRRGTFALRSPVRPNPIASSVVPVIAIEDAQLTVRGLDCVDGTPLIDIKPASGPFCGVHD